MSYQKVFKRTEKKYLVTKEQYRDFEKAITGLTEPDQYGRTEVLNIYYDTPDFRLIRQSLEKPRYKEKLRLRSYGTPAPDSNSFVELKKKYKGVVYKRRVDMPYRDAVKYLNTGVYLRPNTVGNEEQIMKEISYFMYMYPGIGPAMAISYDRLAVNWTAEPGVRITADTDIRYRTDHLDLRYGSRGDLLLAPGTRLLEIKLNGSMPLELAHIMSELEIFPASVSKYGRAYQAVVKSGSLRTGSAALAAAHAACGYTRKGLEAGYAGGTRAALGTVFDTAAAMA